MHRGAQAINPPLSGTQALPAFLARACGRLSISPETAPPCEEDTAGHCPQDLPRPTKTYPSCSVYAETCIRELGPLRGTLRALVRLGKCHPFHPGGYDPPLRDH